VVVMPVRGRLAQTVEAFRRLWATANTPAAYIAVGGRDDYATITAAGELPYVQPLIADVPRLSYWGALSMATRGLDDNALVATVANDLLPVVGWLSRAYRDYEYHTRVSRDAVVGFNGDGYGDEHACHFLIPMRVIRRYGWPTWYDHNFGDNEIVTRAKQDGIWYKSPYAILYHNHPMIGAAQNYDATYEEGSLMFSRDGNLFERRKASNWTAL
jgi:hypothetical protein